MIQTRILVRTFFLSSVLLLVYSCDQEVVVNPNEICLRLPYSNVDERISSIGATILRSGKHSLGKKDQLICYPIEPVNVKEEMTVLISDGSSVTFSLDYWYSFKKDFDVLECWEINSSNYHENLIVPEIRSKTRNLAGDIKPNQSLDDSFSDSVLHDLQLDKSYSKYVDSKSIKIIKIRNGY